MLHFFGEKSRELAEHVARTVLHGMCAGRWPSRARGMAKPCTWQDHPHLVSLHGSGVDMETFTTRLLASTCFQHLGFHACGRFGAAILFLAGCTTPVAMF